MASALASLTIYGHLCFLQSCERVLQAIHSSQAGGTGAEAYVTTSDDSRHQGSNGLNLQQRNASFSVKDVNNMCGRSSTT